MIWGIKLLAKNYSDIIGHVVYIYDDSTKSNVYYTIVDCRDGILHIHRLNVEDAVDIRQFGDDIIGIFIV